MRPPSGMLPRNLAAPRAAGVLATALALVSLTGCAVMNTSVMETAEIVEPGHVKLGVEYNSGLDLTSTVFLEGDTSGTFTADALAGVENYGLKLGVGLTDNAELNAKVWASIGGVGSRVYLKYGLPASGERAMFAIAPGVTFVTTESDDDDDDGSLEEYVAEVTSVGGELPFIATYRWNSHVSVTGVLRYGLDRIEIAFPEGSPLFELNDTYVLHRFGVINGWSFDAGPLYFRPEFGIEMASQAHGDFGVVPVFAGGVGFEF